VTPQDLDAIGALLAGERARAAANEAGLAAELAAIVEASAQANLDDEHDPEGSTVGYERARVASLLQEAGCRMDQLDKAAERLHAGTYGICTRCGRQIASERLIAFPTARSCVGCVEGARPAVVSRGPASSLPSVGHRRPAS